MTIAITGGTGLVGTALLQHLRARGDRWLVVSREPRGPHRLGWDPLEPGSLVLPQDVDAVVHLAGESIYAERWSPEVRERIRSSRVEGTRRVVEAVRAHGGIRHVVSASAVGYYGDRGDELLTEGSAPGDDFFAEVCTAWEAAATELADDAELSTRLAILRTAPVLQRDDGVLGKMLRPFPFVHPYNWGLGGRVGKGTQYFPWIHVEDEVRAILHLLDHDLAGPFNAAAPEQVTNAEFTRALGRALRRPTPIPIPLGALRLLFGGVAEVIGASQRVVPKRLQETGFAFAYPSVDDALQDLLR